jgi:hypothetical protein
MLCFVAVDSAPTAGFNPLASMPSPLDPPPSTGSSSAAPSCVFIRSLPPGPNPSPTFTLVPFSVPLLPVPPPCSLDCCACCGQVNCFCALSRNCCPKAYARAGVPKLLDFQAVGQDPLVPVSIALSYPEGGPDGGLPNGVSMPALLPFRRGCGAAQAYALCLAPSGAVASVTAQLAWDLSNMSDYFCARGGGPCDGPNSPCSGQTGDVCTLRQLAQKTVAPFKMCFQAVQITPANVDLNLFQARPPPPPSPQHTRTHAQRTTSPAPHTQRRAAPLPCDTLIPVALLAVARL